MRKSTGFVIFLLAFTRPAFSQNVQPVVGTWQGKLTVGIELRIVIHITESADGNISSTLDSPDQSTYGINADSTSFKENKLHFSITKLQVSFTGRLENDSTITGEFTQIKSIPLTLTKNDQVAGPPNRPQTPKPPFAYKSEDVEYDNADRTVHFGASFTYPNKPGPFVTAILITGSGQQDRDETILNHKPFAVIADYLTQNGFAVLRIDDRGIGKTTGEVMKATSEDFANDVCTAMDYLRTRKEADPKRIGLIGHSEGGLIASIVITKRKDVAFIISLAGAAIKGKDLLADQGEVIMVKEGIPAEAAKSYHTFYKKIIDFSLSEKDRAEAYKKTWAAYQEWKTTITPAQLAGLGFTDDGIAEKTLRGLIQTLYLPWMQFFNNSEASLNYEKAYCPVLALNGSEDVQVLAKENLPALKTALAKSKAKKCEVLELPGLNHLFQHCKKCSLSEYGQLEESFAPEALQEMNKWLNATMK